MEIGNFDSPIEGLERKQDPEEELKEKEHEETKSDQS